MKSVQRAGTHKVEITYTLATPAPCSITVEVSADGGATYGVEVPPTAFSGDIGPSISAGVRTIVLDAAATTTLNHLFSKQLRFKVVATGVLTLDGFALIPAGSFQMGDQSNPLVGYSDERPVHTVSVSAFYMAQYETTKELWDSVRTWGLNNGYTDVVEGNAGYASKGVNHPEHTISWYDIVKWCNARSQKENLVPCYTVSGAIYKTGSNDAVVCNFVASGYRLPTEAEWEKAARGGVAGKNFPWGTDTISHSQANYQANPGYSYDLSGVVGGFHPTYAVGGYPYSSPVGSFAPNGYGLYDMAGNMREWCWDWYGSYSAGSQTDPRGAASGSIRVLRGSSWGDDAYDCRVAYRSSYGNPGAYYLYGNVGFRVARSSVP